MAEIPGTGVTSKEWLDASKKWTADCKRVQAFAVELEKWTSSRAADRSQDLDAIRQARMNACVFEVLRLADHRSIQEKLIELGYTKEECTGGLYSNKGRC